MLQRFPIFLISKRKIVFYKFGQFKATVTRDWTGLKVVSKLRYQQVDIAGAHFQSSLCPF